MTKFTPERVNNESKTVYLHCKNFPKRYAWLSVTFLDFISFEQVTESTRFFSLKLFLFKAELDPRFPGYINIQNNKRIQNTKFG